MERLERRRGAGEGVTGASENKCGSGEDGAVEVAGGSREGADRSERGVRDDGAGGSGKEEVTKEGGGDCGEVAIGAGEEFEESWEESEQDGKVRVGS